MSWYEREDYPRYESTFCETCRGLECRCGEGDEPVILPDPSRVRLVSARDLEPRSWKDQDRKKLVRKQLRFLRKGKGESIGKTERLWRAYNIGIDLGRLGYHDANLEAVGLDEALRYERSDGKFRKRVRKRYRCGYTEGFGNPVTDLQWHAWCGGRLTIEEL